VYVALYGIGLVYLLALVPAAVICLRKGLVAMFFAGWLTLGLVWLIGAMSGESRRILGVVALGALVAAIVLGAFGARPAPVLGMNGEALESSFGNGNYFLGGPESCGHRPDGSWRCSRWDSQFSGTVSYRVDVNGLGCWHAVRVGPPGEGSPARLSGCVHLGNYFL
jgi:hypothetical protein